MKHAFIVLVVPLIVLGCGRNDSQDAGVADAHDDVSAPQCVHGSGPLVALHDFPVGATTGPDGKSIYLVTSSLGQPSAVSKYDIQTNAWSDFTPLPISTNDNTLFNCNVALTSTTSTIYAMVDCHENVPAPFYAYDFSSSTWDPKASNTSASGSSWQLATVGGKIYSATSDPSTASRGFYAYDESADKWTPLMAPPVSPLHLVGALAIAATNDGRIFGISFYDNEVYDIVSDTWMVIPAAPVQRGTITIAFDGRASVYSFGGCCPSDPDAATTFDEMNQVIDIHSTTWASAAPLPRPINAAGLSLASLGCDGMIYVFGGGTDGTSPSYMMRFDPVTQAWETSP